MSYNYITLEYLRKRKACDDGIAWFESKYGDSEVTSDVLLEDLYRDKIYSWILWATRNLDNFNIDDPAIIDRCAEASYSALKYASKLLTPERLDKCAEEWPGPALDYASHLLTPERLKKCKEKRDE